MANLGKYLKAGVPVIAVAAFFLLFAVSRNILTVGLSQPFPVISYSINSGDNLDWKNVDFDDSSWGKNFDYSNPRYWWRGRIELEGSARRDGPLGLGIRSVLGSYEVYWDGHFIGRNGTVGTSREGEEPGGIDAIFMIPENLSKDGSHLIALRVSQYRSVSHRTSPFFKISDYEIQSKTLIIIAAFMHILAGLFLGISLYYFLLYRKSFRLGQFLLFGIICMNLFLWILLEYVKFYYSYPYHLHYVRLDLISLIAFTTTLLVPFYLLYQFEFKKKYLWLAPLLIFQIAIFYIESDYDRTTWYWITASSLLYIAICIAANLKNQRYSLESMVGIIPLFVASFFFAPFYYDRLIFFSFTFYVLVNLYVLSRTQAEERMKLNASLLRTERLKVELIKKNIQPHFLMNTLTSLISWVEESPATAQRFIQALANEFDALGAVADKTQISIEEEIELCHAHLEVMSYRNEIDYKLKTEGIDTNEMIPPAIFLTLLENGLTHNRVTKEDPIFKLKFGHINSKKIYTFFAPGVSSNSKKGAQTGTGLKYIKARLNESYGIHWRMQQRSDTDGWTTIIEISEA